jgi:hypothetical protein
MPCLFVALALMLPRLLIIGLWLLSDWFNGVFDTALWPVLGFFFLPTTTLWFSAVHHWFGGEWSLWPIVGMVIALMIDTSQSQARRRRRNAE